MLRERVKELKDQNLHPHDVYDEVISTDEFIDFERDEIWREIMRQFRK